MNGRGINRLIGMTMVLLAGCAKDEGPLFVPQVPPVVPGEPIDTAYFTTSRRFERHTPGSISDTTSRGRCIAW